MTRSFNGTMPSVQFTKNLRTYVSGAYSVPVNGWGTRLIVSGSYSQFEVGGALAVLDINAEVKVYDISLTHPVIKSAFQNLQIEAGFASKDNPLCLSFPSFRNPREKLLQHDRFPGCGLP